MTAVTSDLTGAPLRFDHQVVIVTGAGRGIGRAHALAFAARGAAVIVNDPGVEPDGNGGSAQPAQAVVAEITALGGRAVASLASVATQAEAAAIVDLAIRQYGRLDALVNNAGIQVRQPLEALDEDVFRKHLDVHLLGTYFTSRAAWPHLCATRGRVVNTVSGLLFGMEGYSAYAAAKGGIYALTRTLAIEGRQHGIGVNCVCPGAATRLMTGPGTGVPSDVASMLEATLPPSAVAEVVVYLAHSSCALQGECLVVAGNRVSRIVLAETQGARLEKLTAESLIGSLATVLNTDRLSIHTDTAAAVQASQAGAQLNALPQTSALPAAPSRTT
jgi:NAD(P)-dependent dehydrogenase (short-subunit alcohol dehydrogenase family)